MVLVMGFVSGCGDASKVEKAEPEQFAAESAPAPSQKGTTETFAHEDLQLEVTNVKEKKQAAASNGMEKWVYEVYVVYPEAVIAVLNADMMATLWMKSLMRIGLLRPRLRSVSTLWTAWSQWRSQRIFWVCLTRNPASMCWALNWTQSKTSTQAMFPNKNEDRVENSPRSSFLLWCFHMQSGGVALKT